jgi:hypothetical protein
MGLNMWYLFEVLKVLVSFSLTRRTDPDKLRDAHCDRWTSDVVIAGRGWMVKGMTVAKPGEYWDTYVSSSRGKIPEFGYTLQHTPIKECATVDEGVWYAAHRVMSVVLCWAGDAVKDEVGSDLWGNYTLFGTPEDWEKACSVNIDWDRTPAGESCILGSRLTVCDGEGDGNARDWLLGFTNRWVSPAVLQRLQDCGITCVKV